MMRGRGVAAGADRRAVAPGFVDLAFAAVFAVALVD